tara:strand:+ start:206 stop:430 length:225 start_codon:yes stop_codon:yes gene_type:complete
MPGMTNRRRAIQEGTDWTNPKTKGYNFGGPVKVGTGSGYMDRLSAPIAKANKSTSKRKSLIRGYGSGGKVKAKK